MSSRKVSIEWFVVFSFKTYPSLEIGNIVLLDTVLRFDNWCELISSTSDANPRCRTTPQAEESVRPFRCLHQNSAQEESLVSSPDCLRRNIGGPSRCLRAEKWEQMASMDCSNRTMILSSSLKTLGWCGLGEFRGVEFSCCPLTGTRGNDGEFVSHWSTPFRLIDNEASQVDGQDGDRLAEDDPISELLILPKNETVETHQRILAMSQPSSSGTVDGRFPFRMGKQQ